MKRLLSVLLAVMAVLLTATGVSAQDDQTQDEAPPGARESAPSGAIVHRIDAREAITTAYVMVDGYVIDPAEVSVVNDGSNAEVSVVNTARSIAAPQEVVFVLDTSSSLSTGDVFENSKLATIDAIRSLPSNFSVAVVSAGDTTLLEVPMTNDLERAAQAVAELELSNRAAVIDAVNRGAGEFSSGDNGIIRTIVVVSGTADTTSSISANNARTTVVNAGAQIVTLNYQNGETGLRTIQEGAGGYTVNASSPTDLAGAFDDVLLIATDRVVVQFAGTSDTAVRGDAVLNLGSTQTAFSYQGGVATNTKVALAAVEVAEPSGISFFRTTTGLYVALLLVFIAVGLAIFSLGSLFAGGDTSLEGLLDRYSGEGDGAALTDEETVIVQTALVKKAVELSESFAEERGFLVKLETQLEKSNLPLRAGEAMGIFFVGIIIGAALGFIFIGGVIGAIIAAIKTGVGLIFALNFKARRRIRQFEKQLPDTLQLLAGTLRAGYSLPQGLEAVSHEISDPMGYELRRAMTEARLGREIEDALGATAERTDSPDFAWAVMAIGIQREVGGNLNELLMTVSDTMIARERLKGEVAALTAEGKLSAILLGGLPPGLGFIMWLMNPEYINQLFVTTIGNIMLGLGIVAALIGFVWMKKVITIDV